ncbi:organic solvent ABC transporter substrate-binding protein [Flavobacterium psychrophilum]|nr:organic solvent ABC transporter substrate-binding protein [Flavobacterium psychrophilum]AOE51667.1 organic solvent ABC transporter substrate-binding protein [Flavobacterium psychrophilum]
MKVSREVKTAVLVIGSILLFIWGYYFLKGRDLFNSYKTYYVVYKNVEGLSPSAPVTLNGLIVGKVTSITFTDHKEGDLLIEMQVKTDFPISKTSNATLYEPGFIGGKQIAIIPNMNDKTLAEDNDYFQAGLKPGMLSAVGEKLSPLQTKVEATVVSADSLLHRVNNIFDDKTQQNLRIAIAEMSNTMKEFSSAARSLNGSIAGNKGNIDATMKNLNRTSANFAKLSDSIDAANIAQTVRNLEHSLAKVDNLMNDVQSGKGTLGKLMKDEAMYNNLTDASKELKELLADFKNNPKRYVHFSVFGKKATPYTEKVVVEEKK